MVDSVTKKYKFLAVPRKKKKRLFVELTIPFFFRKNGNYVQISKYIMVAEVYLSHIGLRTS